jgi:transposase
VKQTPTSPYVPDLDQLREWLEKMLAAMKFVELVVAVVGLIGRMRDINLELNKRVAQLTRKRPRSETLERLERQLVLPLAGLVATAAATAPAGTAQPPGDEKKKRRTRGGGGRGKFPAHLRIIEVPNPLSPELRICPVCGNEMKTVTHSVCKSIAVIPAQIVIEHRLDETAACPIDDTIVSAPPPPAIVERGKLADTLIVEATCDKYLEHQPVERQCLRFERAGVEIAPQTLGRAVAAHLDLLRPVADLIVEQTRAPGYLGTDATGIPVLDPGVSAGIRTGAIWCWTNARWVSFVYAPHGDSQSVRDFLGDDLCRIVQCDGTNVTSFLERAGGKLALTRSPRSEFGSLSTVPTLSFRKAPRMGRAPRRHWMAVAVRRRSRGEGLSGGMDFLLAEIHWA